MKTAAETEAALTGTFLNRSFRVVFLCHLGKVEVCKKNKKKAEHHGQDDFTTAFCSGAMLAERQL